jgi:hypothetical protein
MLPEHDDFCSGRYEHVGGHDITEYIGPFARAYHVIDDIAGHEITGAGPWLFSYRPVASAAATARLAMIVTRCARKAASA